MTVPLLLIAVSLGSFIVRVRKGRDIPSFEKEVKTHEDAAKAVVRQMACFHGSDQKKYISGVMLSVKTSCHACNERERLRQGLPCENQAARQAQEKRWEAQRKLRKIRRLRTWLLAGAIVALMAAVGLLIVAQIG